MDIQGTGNAVAQPTPHRDAPKQPDNRERLDARALEQARQQDRTEQKAVQEQLVEKRAETRAADDARAEERRANRQAENRTPPPGSFVDIRV